MRLCRVIGVLNYMVIVRFTLALIATALCTAIAACSPPAAQSQSSTHKSEGVSSSTAAFTTATAPASTAGSFPIPAAIVPESLTLDRASMLAHEAALFHPNPFIRECAYHDHDAAWSFDLNNRQFTLTLDEQGSIIHGIFSSSQSGDWAVEILNDKALSDPWVPPATSQLSLEQARVALQAMCSSFPDTTLQGFGKALDSAVTIDTPENPRPLKQTKWIVDLQNRTFTVTSIFVDVGNEFHGQFGWDKARKWTAWPTTYAHITTTGGFRHDTYIAIPKQ
jgi:hypothetical protein